AGIDVQSASTNPFAIQVLSTAPGDLPDFDNNTTATWPIAAGTGITNFVANKFAVDSGSFPDDLAGGYFVVVTNANSLALTFINNRAPVASDANYYSAGTVLQIPIAAL